MSGADDARACKVAGVAATSCQDHDDIGDELRGEPGSPTKEMLEPLKPSQTGRPQ